MLSGEIRLSDEKIFRMKIINELKKENEEIPADWNLMYRYLISKRNLHLIYETVEKLGLTTEDWDHLKSITHNINDFKHPVPRLTKEQATEN